MADVFLTFLNVQLLSDENKTRENKYVIGDCLGVSEDYCLVLVKIYELVCSML